MFYVYLLKSETTNKAYVGFTTDLKQRYESHNAGHNKSTKSGVPWILIYYEAYKDESSARIREKKLKQYGNSLALLKKRLSL